MNSRTMLLTLISAWISSASLSRSQTADFLPLSVGNSWTYNYNANDTDWIGGTITGDSGIATYTITSGSSSPDSTIWQFKESRNILHTYIVPLYPDMNKQYTIIDSLFFDLVEYNAGDHRVLRYEGLFSSWRSVYLLLPIFSDSSKFFRYHPTVTVDTLTVFAQDPAISPYHFLRATFQRSIGFKDLSYALQGVLGESSKTHHTLIRAIVNSVADETKTIPGSSEPLRLDPNYPNPFNPQTVIRFSLAYSARVLAEVYDILGRSIGVILDDRLRAGSHTVTWDASGKPSGVYICVVCADQNWKAIRLVLVK